MQSLKITAQPSQMLKASDQLQYRTSTMPRELWIELTSKCPFNCVFCSRKLLHGAGEHMDFNLYRRLIEDLESPAIIRLNYSGESTHYPQLIGAIELAKRAGAVVELVSAFSSIKEELIPQLIESGLDRLSVSIHTLNHQQYKDIYGFGSLKGLISHLDSLRVWQEKLSHKTLNLDFTFVAMQRNLDQLPELIKLADRYGVTRVDVHPVIRRDEIKEQFTDELVNGKLQADFLNQLNDIVKRVRYIHPAIDINYSTPEPEQSNVCSHLSNQPRHYPWPLPEGASLWSCYQNPWDTVHILANGNVVTCEVRDKFVLGNLRKHSLAKIWQGQAYRLFREQFIAGQDSKCKNCVYKLAFHPSFPGEQLGPKNFNISQLVKGWHQVENDIVWSSTDASVVLSRPAGNKTLRLRGLLPAIHRDYRKLTITINGVETMTLCHAKNEVLLIDQTFKLDGQVADQIWVRFKVDPDYRPARDDGGADTRSLGFALQSLQWLG